MDLHVYALLKRKYNELAEEVEGIVDESAELTEEAKAVLEEVKASLSEVEPLIESAKVNANEAEELVDKAKSLLESIEPEITELRVVLEQVKQNVHTGEYESDRAYLKGNETLYNGSTYRALEDVTGVLPTDTSKWQLVAQRGVDGKGAVSSVNNIAPDENGNVDLGKITADWDDLEGKPEVLEGLGDEDGKLTYKGEEVGEKLVIGRKVYVADGNTTTFKTEFEVEPNTNRVMVYVSGVIQSSGENFTENKDSITLKFTPAKGTQVLVYTFSGSETLFVDGGIDEEDIKHLETKVDAIKKLEEAKKYTDEEVAKIPDVKDTVDTVNEYKKKIRVNSNIGSVQIGNETFNEPFYYLQLGNSSYSGGSRHEGRGSVNISSLDTNISQNRIHHHNAMVFGCGLETLSKSNGPFYQEGVVTYIGQYNQQPTDSNTRFLVGIGNRATEKKTGMRMDSFGDLMINGQYETSGADYAEMFEWEDKNPENTDRVALAVTWGEGESIKLANSGDEIIGIVSATPAILGDNPDEWHNRFITDQFGRPLRKEYTEINEDGKEETYEWFVENPEYDKDAPYISRSERPEWSAIGLMGKLYWIDDGTLEVGDYATVGSNGVATKGDKSNGWRVMKRISKNDDGNSGVVKVFFK